MLEKPRWAIGPKGQQNNNTMFKNYFKTASRYLLKNKGYTLINVFGLSIGLAAFIMLGLFVRVEFSYDEDLSQKELIHQVYL